MNKKRSRCDNELSMRKRVKHYDSDVRVLQSKTLSGTISGRSRDPKAKRWGCAPESSEFSESLMSEDEGKGVRSTQAEALSLCQARRPYHPRVKKQDVSPANGSRAKVCEARRQKR